MITALGKSSGERASTGPNPNRLAIAVGVAALYVPGSLLAIAMADITGMDAVFFPPAGLTVAAMLRLPRRSWPAILIGACLAELGTDLATGFGLAASAGFALANTVEPLVGAVLTTAMCRGAVDLTRRNHTIGFVIGAALLGPALGGAIGATVDWVAIGDDPLATIWQWWLGDSLAVVVIGGAILAWGSSPDRRDLWSPQGIGLLALTAASLALAVGQTDLPLEFLVGLATVAAGAFFGVRGVTSVALVAVASLAVGLAVESGSLWTGVPDATALTVIKAELIVVTVTGLMVAAEVIERHMAASAQASAALMAELAAASEAFTRRVLDNLFSFAWVLTPTGTLLESNRAPLEAAGLSPAGVAGRKLWETWWWGHNPDVQAELRQAVTRAVEGETIRYDASIRVADNRLMWIDFLLAPLRNDTGEITHLVASGLDLTPRKAAEEHLQTSLIAEQAARHRVELLERNARHLAAATTVDELAESVLTDLEAALGIERGTVMIGDGNTVRIVAQISGTDDVDRGISTVAGDAMLPGPEALRDNIMVIVDDPTELVRRFPALAHRIRGSGTGGVAALPLRSAKGEPLGALEIWIPAGGELSSETRSVLSSVASQTGQALERASLHQRVVEARDREHAVAVRLQLALLPETVVEHPNLSITAHYEAAGDVMAVGGDWYDTFSWSTGHVGLMVGDICGHDLDATIAMGRLRAAMAATAPLCHPDPAAVMDVLDNLARNADDHPFATAVCLIIDPATGYVRYTIAGHPPPIVVNPDGTIVWLDDARTAPAGTILVDGRPRAEMQLESGAVLVLYSDGLIERRGEPLDAGLERLAEAARRGAGLDSAAFLEGLTQELAEPGQPEDDSIVLCTRWDRPDR